MLDVCASTERDPDYVPKQIECRGFIAGVASSAKTLQVWRNVCVFDTSIAIPFTQARDIVVKYLRDLPTQRHDSGSSHVDRRGILTL